MAKTRLTKYDRQAIRTDIIAHRFDPQERALLAEENALAIQVRAKLYGDYLATIEAAPEGAFCMDSSFTVNVGGKRIRLAFGADYKTQVRLFAVHCKYDPVMSVPDSDKFGAKIADWAQRKEATRTAREKLSGEVLGTLNSFNSFDDLQAGWPEADRFIVARWQTRPEYSANVPAIALRDLSAALDLPPDEVAAA